MPEPYPFSFPLTRSFCFSLPFQVKPQGLVLDPKSGLVCLIKLKCLSFVRPVSAIEHLVLAEAPVAPAVAQVTTQNSFEATLLLLQECTAQNLAM